MQQNKNKNNNLLSIPAQVLAYSFQFLSYKQLCKTQSVCVYFMYLNKQYPGLTHYYICLNRSFFTKAMRFQICLNNLSMFKRIHINAVYGSHHPWNKDQERRSTLFKNILTTIIKQSITNLDVIEIDTNYSTIRRVNNSPHFNVLLFIMNKFNTLPISKLIWSNDLFKPSRNKSILNILQEIKPKIKISFPNLKQFKIGRGIRIFFPGFSNHGSIVVPSESMLNKYVVVPVINNYSHQLECLHLDDDFDYFNQTPDLIKIIAENMKTLKKLSMSVVESTSVEAVHANNIKQYIGLTELKLELSNRHSLDAQQAKKSFENILSYLFSTFINITKFEYVSSY
eukprot:415869_1